MEPDYLQNKTGSFLSTIKDLGGNQISLFGSDVEPMIPERHIERINYWFSEENKIELGKILKVICSEDDEKIRDFLLVAFSNVLKNCSIWMQGSTKTTRDFKQTLSNSTLALLAEAKIEREPSLLCQLETMGVITKN